MEYGIRDLDVPGSYGAVNHVQHLGYWFNSKGYGVSSFNEDGSTKGTWQAQFLIEGVGRGARLRAAGNASASRDGGDGDHKLSFDYGTWSVSYDHEKPGMEQTFVVRRRPAGVSPLRVVLRLAGDLDAAVDGDDALRLYVHGHPEDTRLVYDQLHVRDANHRCLPAHMELDGRRRLVLSVDDSKAVYPVTVDPFAHGTSIVYTAQGILNSGILDATVHTLFGYAVAGADVNADGINDLIIGAPNFASISGINASGGGTITLSATITGAAFVYYGVALNGPSTNPSKVLQPSGLSVGALFGFSVASIGNAAGGTHAGVMIGAPGQQTTAFGYVGGNPVAIGAVYVYYANDAGGNFHGSVASVTSPNATLMLTVNDFTSTSSPATHNPMFGFSIADAGDVDGDGSDDIIVGSPTYQEAPTAFPGGANGRIDIFKGSTGGVSGTHTTTIYGSQTGELFGFSVNTAGNINGDGFKDIVVGAPGNLATTALIHGRAYVFYGASGGISATTDNPISSTVGLTLNDPNTLLQGTLFGFSVSTAGDVDNDGHGDVVVGAPLTPNGATFGSRAAIGAAYVFYGGTMSAGALSPSNPMVSLISPRASSALNFMFGWSVGNAGNVTGDASGDVLVGEPASLPLSGSISATLTALGIDGSLSSNAGQAYVYSGNSGTGISASSSMTISDATTPNQLGYAVRTVGDVDGDGNPDFMIGEPGGSLDLSFNLAGLAGNLGAGPGSTLGTLTSGTNGGLLVNASIGNARLFFGSSTALPVTLLNFTGQAQGVTSLLSWSTSSELNSDYFQVERSTDGKNFTAIGKVTAVHNSTTTTDYTFTDPAPVAGNNYYRLNMVDMDGQSSYSNIVVVIFSGGGVSGKMVTAYPNPAHGSFQLLFRNMAAGRYGMNLINAVGQIIFTRYVQVADPVSYNETVNLGDGLPPGTYVLRLVDQHDRMYVTQIIVK